MIHTINVIIPHVDDQENTVHDQIMFHVFCLKRTMEPSDIVHAVRMFGIDTFPKGTQIKCSALLDVMEFEGVVEPILEDDIDFSSIVELENEEQKDTFLLFEKEIVAKVDPAKVPRFKPFYDRKSSIQHIIDSRKENDCLTCEAKHIMQYFFRDCIAELERMKVKGKCPTKEEAPDLVHCCNGGHEEKDFFQSPTLGGNAPPPILAALLGGGGLTPVNFSQEQLNNLLQSTLQRLLGQITPPPTPPEENPEEPKP